MSAPITEQADRLEAWLSPRLAERHGAEAGAVTAVAVFDLRRPAAGQSNDTTLFTARWRFAGADHQERFVIRRQPTGRQIFLQPDVLREAAVLSGLADTAVPAPTVWWTEPDPAVLEAPFFVMAQVAGTVPLGKPSIHTVGYLPTLTTEQRERLWHSAMETLVAIHAVDWGRSHRFLLAGTTADRALDAHVDQMIEWYRWTTKGRSFPLTDAAVQRIIESRHDVTGHAPVLVWGDARVGNIIFGADCTVAAVIDWETATVGPPELDLARWLFFDDFSTTTAGIEPLSGWPDQQTTIARYEALSGRTIEHLGFFQLLDELFMATTLIRQSDLRVDKAMAPADSRMGHDNHTTQMIARRLGLEVPELSPDYVAHRAIPPAQL